MSRLHVVALMFCTVLGAVTAVAADRREIELRKARVEFWKCWDTGDASCMANMVTDDFVQFSAQATFLDKAAFLAELKSEKYSKISNRNLDDVVDPQVRFYGTSAIRHVFRASACVGSDWLSRWRDGTNPDYRGVGEGRWQELEGGSIPGYCARGVATPPCRESDGIGCHAVVSVDPHGLTHFAPVNAAP